MKVFVWIAVVFVLNLAVGQGQTCQNLKKLRFPRKCNKVYYRSHPMCKYWRLGRQCRKKMCKRGLTPDEKVTIVKMHNDMRRKVAKGSAEGPKGRKQPTASNMNKLTWSDELAETAQRWADKCNPKLQHAKQGQRKTMKYESGAGENLSIGTNRWSPSRLTSLTRLLEIWFEEVAYFDPDEVGYYKGQMGKTYVDFTGHYVQAVWAKTKEIGCGMNKYQVKGKMYFKVLLVCRYGPTGNVMTRSLYEKGSTGSGCTSNQEDGLCL